jgi:hypothetical protein
MKMSEEFDYKVEDYHHLTIVPLAYFNKVHGIDGDGSTYCTQCANELRVIEVFENQPGVTVTDYPSILTVCPVCDTFHLELLDDYISSFIEPVTISWPAL